MKRFSEVCNSYYAEPDLLSLGVVVMSGSVFLAISLHDEGTFDHGFSGL